jgi:hypothetical protein
VGRLGVMARGDDVPEADRLEQETPVGAERDLHPLRPDAPDADVLEQEAPLLEECAAAGIDAERTEPVSDEDWAATSSG